MDVPAILHIDEQLMVQISGQIGAQPVFEATHGTLDNILQYEMPVLLNSPINSFSVFDFIYGSHVFHGGSSKPLATQVAAYLIKHGLIQQLA
jgi:hypothetical protein